MRLTHAITMQAPNRADLQVTVLPEGDALPITLEQDGGAINDGQTVYMSFEQYDVISELVQRVRPAPSTTGDNRVPGVSYGICGHRARYGTCVMAGNPHPRHINALGMDVEDGSLL